ncbi:energy transducer TonB [Moheibacter sediminis]|uniref:TonB family C-terminal domain-containing protein n=1 Tax=Moheibacter sediminis TaxID=1434700 RepID=A0A1W1YIX8_9FLAO|nr:energy transducer TonB [Moheibacter sediminis]SMC35761.1 TonB family C-terminal domain-containing protein [Moheibacter sediminis]
MKNSILTIFIVCISGISFAQNKIEKCNTVAQEKQKSCKDHLIADLISDYAEYPEHALNNSHEGTVYVRFTTNANSDLQNVRILGKSDAELADAAKSAIEKFSHSDAKSLLAQNEVYRIPVRFEAQ